MLYTNDVQRVEDVSKDCKEYGMTTTSSLTLTTLTPIWTGGVEGKSLQLHATGIMGSLRWWYEVLVRSVGGTACDPSQSPHICLYDREKPNNGLCDVCTIFGATGWTRRFKLVVTENTLEPQKPAASTIDRSGGLIFTLSSDHPSTRTPKPKWYLKSNPLYGRVKLDIVSTAPLKENSTEYLDARVITALIQLIADRASIGAKPQLGMGVVQLAERQDMQPLIEHFKQIVARYQKKGNLKEQVNEELPCLQNMFFARIKVDSATESDTFDIKYDLRDMFRQEFKNDGLRHTVMGFVPERGDREVRQGAKIMVSYPYENGTVRIWGWIPKFFSSQLSRSGNSILDEICGYLVDVYGEKDTDGKKYIPFWLDYDPKRHGNVLHYLEHYLFLRQEQNNA